MKNLANCTPREFLRQTNRIRKAAARWLEGTDALAIRRRGAGEGESGIEQAARNLRDILEAALEKCPDETAELLGLMCFIEPEELDQHSMAELLTSATELLNSPEVADFFTSLARWGRSGIFTAAS